MSLLASIHGGTAKPGVNTTARYALEHLTDFDTGKIVTSINQDSLAWLTGATKEKTTSMKTIAKFILIFNRDIETFL